MKTSIRQYFCGVSYIAILAGFLTMFFSGTVGFVSLLFFAIVLVSSWFTEGTRWRISERLGLFLILLSLPLFYFVWRINPFTVPFAQLAVATLAQMIVSISAIKLFQEKSSRDWGFLLLISFFEVLLAAGSSISPTFFVCLVVYVLSSIGSILLFEISKAVETVEIVNDAKVDSKPQFRFRFPLIILSLLAAILITAIPLFFAVPRFGSAGFGVRGELQNGFVGFSNSVQLGKLGVLRQNQQIALRAEIQNLDGIPQRYRKWRGIALDRFDNANWSKSVSSGSEVPKNSGQLFLISNTDRSLNPSTQAITLEAMDSANLFTLPNPVEIRGDFSAMFKDSEDSLVVIGDSQRIAYFVESENNYPAELELVQDRSTSPESKKRYLQLPQIDPRIRELTETIVRNKNAKSRFEKARAIETYLQSSFAYSLDLRATGNEPLADFLFEKKSGHCEYFATALAVMLRTQGIETRMVNGFQLGEYNQTAEMFIVKQRDAHSWVEVYFPASDSWVPFDPTPSVEGSDETSLTLAGRLSGYAEALETIWIQYFVSYDNKNQRSLFRSLKNEFRSIQSEITSKYNDLQKFLQALWSDLKGEKGFEASIYAIIKTVSLIGFALVMIPSAFLLGRRVWRLHFWRNWKQFFRKSDNATIIEFYERMTKALSRKGFIRSAHQTPMEFAVDLDSNEAVRITENYQRVRFGKQTLSDLEIVETENWLRTIETEK